MLHDYTFENIWNYYGYTQIQPDRCRFNIGLGKCTRNQNYSNNPIDMTGGPSVPVSLGRRDGLVSLASNVRANIIDTGFSVDAMARSFAAKGLTLDDLVTLSGGHTIGSAHCTTFGERFRVDANGSTVPVDAAMNTDYAGELIRACSAGEGTGAADGGRFRVDANGSTVPVDAAMNTDYAGELIRACSAVNGTVSSTAAVDCDEGSALRFDNAYFANLLAGRGLLRTDAVLVQNTTTRATVEAFARSEESFFASWAVSFARLTSLGVRTGADGEVRRLCSRVNG
uniref:L-ascorbate peroxidase n=1 Tax=Oryza brachyantha TaxID=4533 RepID=J3LZA0_ORYBR